jgi:CRP-like cAMP-binding protein
MMQREPTLGHALQLAMADAYRDAHDRILHMATSGARSRFLRLCADLARAEGVVAAPSGYSLRLPITYQDIAQVLSLSPETVSRTVRRLHMDRVISMSGRQIDVAAGWMDHCRDEAA